MSGRAWRIDLSDLTGADVPDIIGADRGNAGSVHRLLAKTIRPADPRAFDEDEDLGYLACLPLAEYQTARKEVTAAALDVIFRSGPEDG